MAARRSGGADAEPVAFQLLHRGERLEGLAPGIDRRELLRLRDGHWPPEARVDLHGLPAAEARALLREALRDALEDELRCLLVIHGRGLHSEGGPRLKQELPRWLGEAPHGPRVMAFASARPAHGGAGACYVLLRRRRRMLGA